MQSCALSPLLFGHWKENDFREVKLDDKKLPCSPADDITSRLGVIYRAICLVQTGDFMNLTLKGTGKYRCV